MNGFLNSINLRINAEFKSEMDKYIAQPIVSKFTSMIGPNYYYPASRPLMYDSIRAQMLATLGDKTFLGDLRESGYLTEYILDWSYRILGTHRLQDHQNSHAKFIQTLQTLQGYVELSNDTINSCVNGIDVSAQTFTSMDDLMTGNLSLITSSTNVFGNDLLNTGIFLDFKDLINFGTPHSLVTALIRSSAIGLLKDDFIKEGIEIGSLMSAISSSNSPLLMDVQQTIYAISKTITGEQLIDVLLMLNMDTKGITVLSDLLDLTKIFPLSYASLNTLINGEIYPIFVNNGVTAEVSNLSTPHISTMPANIAKTNLAFRNALYQIKNIMSTRVPDLAKQFIEMEINAGLDSISKTKSALPTAIINSTENHEKILASSTMPVGVNEGSTGILQHIARGQNTNGTFFITDGVGSPTGRVHMDTISIFNKYIDDIPEALTTELVAKLDEIIDETAQEDALARVEYEIDHPPPLPGDYSPTEDEYVTARVLAHIEDLGLINHLQEILNSLPAVPAEIPEQYNATLHQIEVEKATLNDALDYPEDVYAGLDSTMSVSASRKVIMGFTSSLHGQSEKTDLHNVVEVLEKLAVSNQTGDAIIAALREGRNLNKLNKVNVSTDILIDPTPKIINPGELKPSI